MNFSWHRFTLVWLICLVLLVAGCNQQAGVPSSPVSPVSKVTLSSATISPATVAANQTVMIGVNVLNSGKDSVEQSVQLKINDASVETKNITLASGETQTVVFQYVPTIPGTFRVDVNGQKGTFEAIKPAHITASSLKITPETPAAGQEIQISAELTNDGDLGGSFSNVLKVNGKDISAKDVPVEPGKPVAVKTSYIPETSGMYLIEYSGLTGSIKILKGAELKSSDMLVSPTSVLTGDPASISATITNIGEARGTLPVALIANGNQVDSQSVTLEPGGSATVKFSFNRSAPGSYNLSILSSSATLNVVELNKYTSRSYYYTISYPQGFNLNESVPATVVIEKSDTGGTTVLVDRVAVSDTPRAYFDAVAAGKKKQLPDWTTSNEVEFKEDGATVGYRYDYSNTVSGRKWLGKGIVIKKGGFGYYAVFTTFETEWEKNRALAVRVLDSFTTPKIAVGAYTNVALGVALTLPADWCLVETRSVTNPLALIPPQNLTIVGQVVVENVPAGTTPQQYINSVASSTAFTNFKGASQGAFTFASATSGYEWNASGTANNVALKIRMISVAEGNRMITLIFTGIATGIDSAAATITQLSKTLVISSPSVAGVNKNESLFLLAGDIPTLDPAVTEEGTDDTIGALFTGLVKIDAGLKVVADLAEKWTVSPDGKTYTFNLRKNARFHDGKAVTAADVKFSWERACDPALKSAKASYFLNDIVGVKDRLEGKSTQISGIKVIDDSTLQVTLDAAKQYFLSKLTQPVTFIVDRTNVEKGVRWFEQPNGTGPFKLKSWQKDSQVVLERNNDFYLGAAKLKNVVFKLFAGNSLTLYQNGDIDITRVGGNNVDQVLDAANPLNKQLLSGANLSISYVALNVNKPPFDDPKVRQAFALALDVNKIIEVTLNKRAERAAGYLPQGIPGFNSSLQPLPFDPAQAKLLLAQSKYGGSGNLPSITMTVPLQAGSIQQAIIGMWQQNLGVQVKIEAVSDVTAFFEKRRKHDFQVMTDGWNADFVDPQNFLEVLFQSQSSENSIAYSNPAVDSALAQASVEPVESVRIKAYQDIEKMILNDLPAIPLYRNSMVYSLVKPYIKGFVLTPINVGLWAGLSVDPH